MSGVEHLLLSSRFNHIAQHGRQVDQSMLIKSVKINPGTNGAEESVIVSEVSSFQRLKCMQEWYLGWEKVSCLERCPQFRGVLIEGPLFTHSYKSANICSIRSTPCTHVLAPSMQRGKCTGVRARRSCVVKAKNISWFSRKVPEGSVVDSQVGVVSRVSVPSHIPHPNIESSVGQDVRKALVGKVD